MKQYFTGFFTAVCLNASAFLFMGSQNKNLGDIEADSIALTSELGLTVIKGGAVAIYNTDFKPVAIIMNDSDSNGGIIQTYNAEKKETTFLGTGKSGSGVLKTYNVQGIETGYFGTNVDNDGQVYVSDRYGDVGWGAESKK